MLKWEYNSVETKEIGNDDFICIEGVKREVEIKNNDEFNDIGKDEDDNEKKVEEVKVVENNEIEYSGIVEGKNDFDEDVEMIVVLIVVLINPDDGKEVKEVDSFSFFINVDKEIGIVDSIVDIDILDDKGKVEDFNSKLKSKLSFSILSSQVFEIFKTLKTTLSSLNFLNWEKVIQDVI